MPRGMLLRSNWTATQIASPDSFLSLEAFQKANGVKFNIPVPLERFVEYGKWYQAQAVADLDHREVSRIEIDTSGFYVILHDGEIFRSPSRNHRRWHQFIRLPPTRVQTPALAAGLSHF